MKTYLVALSVGTLVGVLYGALNVRSPAPPVVALVGLLGMLVGEQVVPIVKQLASGQRITLAAVAADCVHHVFGPLPRRQDGSPTAPSDLAESRPGTSPLTPAG